MRKSFEELEKEYPLAMQAFASWMFESFKVTRKMYNQSFVDHQYIIAARFFGHSLTVPETPEQAIESMIAVYDNAANNPVSDPLKELEALDWDVRNKHTSETFVRQISSSLYDTLYPIAKFAFKGLSEALIPFKVEVPRMIPQTVSVGIDEDAFWLENIQWCWKCNAGLIQIPF